jgi:acetyl-CoA C-acetyltransferase
MAADSTNRTPVIVGVSRITERKGDNPLADLISRAAFESVCDAVNIDPVDARRDPHLVEGVIKAIGAIATPGTFFETAAGRSDLPPVYPNMPFSIGKRLGVDRDKVRGRLYKTGQSGNSPQMYVNKMAQMVSDGEIECALVCGGEVLNSTTKKLRKKDFTFFEDWRDDDDNSMGPAEISPEGLVGDMMTQYEKKNGIRVPVMVYPLFENAIRKAKGHSIAQHLEYMGNMLEGFSAVAAKPENAAHAWFPTRHTSRKIASPIDGNRWVGFPYTKLMNSMLYVDQSAATLLMSYGMAKKLGVPEDKMVFLHGCGDTKDPRPLTLRADLDRSIPVQVAGEEACRMAGIQASDIDVVDLYACFPSSVQLAAQALQMEDKCNGTAEGGEKLTLIGGLMYNGGPGANTATHSIVAMVERLRRSKDAKGLVYANGGFMTKHSIGIYSTSKPSSMLDGRKWVRADPRAYQAEMEKNLPVVELTETAQGRGVVETYSVMHGNDGKPSDCTVIGTMLDGADQGKRFCGAVPKAQVRALFSGGAILDNDALGVTGTLHTAKGKCTFTFAPRETSKL